VALGQPADEAVEIAVGARPQDEVPVVGHQAPSRTATSWRRHQVARSSRYSM
jgi:hypothetical protein